MHLAVKRGAASMRHLRTPLPGTGAINSVGASRSFSASSFLPRNFFSSSSGSGGSSKTACAAAFFLDAKAACKGKRCALGKNGSGIVSAPESCGEDSFFVSPSIVGVADGVGGWNENGVDPGEISRSLMRNANVFVKKNADANVEITTQSILAYAFKQALLDESVEAGSTTACIVRVKESVAGKPILEYSNLGDSGFVIIRNSVVVFRSKFQVRTMVLCLNRCGDCLACTDHNAVPCAQYYGRAPYQLAKIPPRFKSYGAIENHPRDVRCLMVAILLVFIVTLTIVVLLQADSGEIEVQDGDIIVLATDGVWDNFAPNLMRAPTFQPVSPLRAMF